MKRKQVVSYIGILLVIALAVIIIVMKPIHSLSGYGQIVLSGIIITLGLWIFKPFSIPFSGGALFFAAYMLMVKMPGSIVFSGFTQSAVWTLISALYFGFVLKKTGLGNRLALMILKLFKPSYPTLILSWALIGIVLSVLTPSMTVRVAIVMPIAVSCCELCKLEAGSKGASLILLTAFSMALIPGAGWLTGSLTGPILQGAYNAVNELQGMLTFSSWFSVAFVPVEIASLLLLILSFIFMRPKEKLSSEAAQAIKETKLSKVSKDEIVAMVVFVICFVLFLFGGKLGISSTVVCFGAVIIFFVFGIIRFEEIGTGINWDLIIFIGMALGLGNICEKAGIIEWLSNMIVPALRAFSGNPLIFVIVVTTVLFLWHFIDIASFFPTFAILPAMLPAISRAYGISPLVFAPILALAGCAFFVSYENHWVIMAESSMKNMSWRPKQLAAYGLIYFISSLAGIIVSVPIWINSGLIY